MRKINWGIIGLGNIANKFAHAINAMDTVDLEGVASRDKAMGFHELVQN